MYFESELFSVRVICSSDPSALLSPLLSRYPKLERHIKEHKYLTQLVRYLLKRLYHDEVLLFSDYYSRPPTCEEQCSVISLYFNCWLTLIVVWLFAQVADVRAATTLDRKLKQHFEISDSHVKKHVVSAELSYAIL